MKKKTNPLNDADNPILVNVYPLLPCTTSWGRKVATVLITDWFNQFERQHCPISVQSMTD